MVGGGEREGKGSAAGREDLLEVRERLKKDDIWGNICNFRHYESQYLNNDANGQENIIFKLKQKPTFMFTSGVSRTHNRVICCNHDYSRFLQCFHENQN